MSVIENVRPFLVILKVVGVFSYGWSKDRIVKGPWYDRARILLLIMLIPLSLSRQLYILITVDGSKIMSFETMENILLLTDYVAIYIGFTFNIVNAVFKHEEYCKFFQLLQSYDEEVKSLGHHYKMKVRVVWVTVSVLISIAVATFLHTAIFYSSFVSWRTEHTWIASFNILATLPCALNVCLLYERFRHKREELQSYFSWIDLDIAVDRSIPIARLIRLHTILHEASLITSRLFGIPHCATALHAYTYALISVNNLTRRSRAYRYYAKLSITVLTIAPTFIFCWICDMTCEQANDSSVIVAPNTHLANTDQLQLRLRYAFYRDNYAVSFNAEDFFELNLGSFVIMLMNMMFFLSMYYGTSSVED